MRNTAIRISLVVTIVLATGGAQSQPPPGKIGLIYPLVPGHGGVVPLPRAAEQPRKGAKAVFDISADAKPGEVNKGLEQVARLLNLYGAAGLRAGDVKIAAVFHGEADKAVLSDAAYVARFKVAANRPALDPQPEESRGGSVRLRAVLARAGVQGGGSGGRGPGR